MKRYIIATRNNGYCGCDETECYIFPEGTTDKEIDKYIEEGMYDYAENYENSVRGYDEDGKMKMKHRNIMITVALIGVTQAKMK